MATTKTTKKIKIPHTIYVQIDSYGMAYIVEPPNVEDHEKIAVYTLDIYGKPKVTTKVNIDPDYNYELDESFDADCD